MSSDPGTHRFPRLDNPACARARRVAARPVLLFGYNWLSHQRRLWWPAARRAALFRATPICWVETGLPGRAAWRSIFSTSVRRITYVARPTATIFAAWRAGERCFSRRIGRPTQFDAATAVRTLAGNVPGRLGLTGKRVALFAGKFHERKQPVSCCRRSSRLPGPTTLGSGATDRKRTLTAWRHRPAATVPSAVRQPDRDPVRYRLGHFALPSRGYYETWAGRQRGHAPRESPAWFPISSAASATWCSPVRPLGVSPTAGGPRRNAALGAPHAAGGTAAAQPQRPRHDQRVHLPTDKRRALQALASLPAR